MYFSVFSTKLRVQHVETSTDSERNGNPELYIEERWIKRRTRRRANRKRLSRQDSRSFSEEELRLSKTSKADVGRRALSENSRYKDEVMSDDEGEEECADVLVAREVEKRGNKEG